MSRIFTRIVWGGKRRNGVPGGRNQLAMTEKVYL